MARDFWLRSDSSFRTVWEMFTRCHPTTPMGARDIRRNQNRNLKASFPRRGSV